MRKSLLTGFLSLMLIVTLITYPVESATITVCALGCDYARIKDAVDNANPGDTILVGAGTYVENARIDITKNLTIIGAGASSTIIRPNFDTALNAKTNFPSTPDESIFYIAPNTTFKLTNVTIDGSGKKIHIAIQSRGILTVEDCVIANVRHAQYWGRGIAIYENTQNSVKRCTFSNIERIDILVRGAWFAPHPFAYIEGNTIVGKGNGDLINYGIELGGGGQATIVNNMISDFRGFASGRWNSAGIFTTTVYGPGTRATVYGNTILDCSFGIHVGYRSTTVDTSVVEATCNSIMNNVTGIHSTGPQVLARSNWWGSDTGPNHPTLNPAGIGNPVSDYIDFVPWLSKPGCAPPKAKSNPSYLLSMLPAAVNHISESKGLFVKATDLLTQAKALDKNTQECEYIIEEARVLLEKSESLLTNPIHANNLAQQAIRKLNQAIDCLEILLG